MKHSPLFNARLPLWWEHTATLIRGAAIGFFLGYLFSLLISPDEESVRPIVVVATTFVIALLPSFPKALIEQRNRIRAVRDGTFQGELKQYKESTAGETKDPASPVNRSQNTNP